jgi:hypothetical protein
MGLVLAPCFAAAADHTGDPNWIHDSSSGCWIYNANPQHDEAMAWEGPSCGYGQEANGVGTVTWFQYNQWQSAEKGEMQNGVMQGFWIRRYKNGDIDEANWIDGVRQEPQQSYADDNSSGGSSGSTYSPVYNGDAYMDTLRRQNRENCERASKGADIPCHPE